MQVVEKHIINSNHFWFKEVDRLCFLSKNLFNYANYLIRQKFIFEGKYLNYNAVQKLCQGTPDYVALPCEFGGGIIPPPTRAAKVSQQVLLRLHESWQSFFAACTKYKENPQKFLGRPKLPKYKHKTQGRNVVIYIAQAVSKEWLKKGVIHLSKANIFLTTLVKQVCQIRIVPSLHHCVIEVVYEKEETTIEQNLGSIAGIDIGLNNLATITSNQKGFRPLLINGRPLKSINAYYNKKKSRLQSQIQGDLQTSRKIQQLTHKRNCKVDNYLHNASRFIINHLVANSCGTLVIGKNNCWKQEINLGKRNNQNFVSNPHARFIEMLTYKAQLAGIKVIVTEESYTSKCSFLDNESINKHEKYQGQRIKRGLFRSSSGTLINADVNGSANIIKKAFPNAFVEGIQGVVAAAPCPGFLKSRDGAQPVQ